MDKEELSWKEISAGIDLYKFYIELLIKTSTFLFLISGGMVAYFLAHSENPALKYSLFLPIIMNSGFVAICLYSVSSIKLLIKDFEDTCNELDWENPYELKPLLYFLWIFSISYVLVVIGLLSLLIFPEITIE